MDKWIKIIKLKSKGLSQNRILILVFLFQSDILVLKQQIRHQRQQMGVISSLCENDTISATLNLPDLSSIDPMLMHIDNRK